MCAKQHEPMHGHQAAATRPGAAIATAQPVDRVPSCPPSCHTSGRGVCNRTYARVHLLTCTQCGEARRRACQPAHVCGNGCACPWPATPRPPRQHAQVPAGLSQLGRTADGLLPAFLTATVRGTDLGNAAPLAAFPHLQTVQLPDNRITDLRGLSDLTCLTHVDASGNKLTQVRQRASSCREQQGLARPHWAYVATPHGRGAGGGAARGRYCPHAEQMYRPNGFRWAGEGGGATRRWAPQRRAGQGLATCRPDVQAAPSASRMAGEVKGGWGWGLTRSWRTHMRHTRIGRMTHTCVHACARMQVLDLRPAPAGGACAGNLRSADFSRNAIEMVRDLSPYSRLTDLRLDYNR